MGKMNTVYEHEAVKKLKKAVDLKKYYRLKFEKAEKAHRDALREIGRFGILGRYRHNDAAAAAAHRVSEETAERLALAREQKRVADEKEAELRRIRDLARPENRELCIQQILTIFRGGQRRRVKREKTHQNTPPPPQNAQDQDQDQTVQAAEPTEVEQPAQAAEPTELAQPATATLPAWVSRTPDPRWQAAKEAFLASNPGRGPPRWRHEQVPTPGPSTQPDDTQAAQPNQSATSIQPAQPTKAAKEREKRECRKQAKARMDVCLTHLQFYVDELKDLVREFGDDDDEDDDEGDDE